MKKIVPTDAIFVPATAAHVFKGIIHDVYHWPQTQFDGSTRTFEMLRRPDTVVVIGLVDGEVILIHDEQPHRGTKLNLPGGRVDDEDGSTLHAAQRELHEETGYSFANWRLVQVIQPSSKNEWFIYLYIAWDVTGKDTPHLDVGEKISLAPLPYISVREMGLTGNGNLGEAVGLLERYETVEELLAAPKFEGQEIDR